MEINWGQTTRLKPRPERELEDPLVQRKSTLAVKHVLMQPKRERSCANAIKIPTGLVRISSNWFMQLGSDPVVLFQNPRC